MITGRDRRQVRVAGSAGLPLAVLCSLVLPAIAIAASEPKELAAISEDLAAGRVEKAEERCLEQPRRLYDLAARLPYGASRQPQPGLYANLFARCSVVALRAGRNADASWRWHLAHVFDPKVATAEVTLLGALAELPAVRRAGTGLPADSTSEAKAWREVEAWMLGAPDDVFRPNVTDRSRLSLRGGFKCSMDIEAILGRDGRLHEPALVSRQNCVIDQVSLILDALGRRPFAPARSEGGEMHDVAYRLALAERVEPASR